MLQAFFVSTEAVSLSMFLVDQKLQKMGKPSAHLHTGQLVETGRNSPG